MPSKIVKKVIVLEMSEHSTGFTGLLEHQCMLSLPEMHLLLPLLPGSIVLILKCILNISN